MYPISKEVCAVHVTLALSNSWKYNKSVLFWSKQHRLVVFSAVRQSQSYMNGANFLGNRIHLIDSGQNFCCIRQKRLVTGKLQNKGSCLRNSYLAICHFWVEEVLSKWIIQWVWRAGMGNARTLFISTSNMNIYRETVDFRELFIFEAY